MEVFTSIKYVQNVLIFDVIAVVNEYILKARIQVYILFFTLMETLPQRPISNLTDVLHLI